MTHIEAYFPLIRQIIRLYHTTFLEPDDLFQEACLALLEGPERTDEHDIALAIHRAIHHAIRRHEAPHIVRLLPKDEQIPDETTIATPDIEELMTLARLSPRQQMVLSLHFGLNGNKKCSYRQIAAKLDIRERAVERIINRAIRRLKKNSKK